MEVTGAEHSTSTSSPRPAVCIVPQEIVDTIIDFFHDDPQALASCATVCRGWLPSTRIHLFYKVHVDSTRKLRKLHALLDKTPTLAPLIRYLSIVTTAGIIDNVHILDSKLERLEALRLSSVAWCETSPQTKDWLLERWTPIKRLELVSSSFDTIKGFLCLIQARPSLTDLILDDVIIRPSTVDASYPTLPISLLQINFQSTVFDRARTLETLLSSRCFARVPTIHIIVDYHRHEFVSAKQLLSHIGTSLRHVTIEMVSNYSIATLEAVQCVDLFSCTPHLHHFNIHDLYLDFPSVASILPLLLSRLHSQSQELRTIGIQGHWRPTKKSSDCGPMNWSEIDAILDSGFGHLRSVAIRICLRHTPCAEFDISEFSSNIKAGFQGLISRRILRLIIVPYEVESWEAN
ncbi:hypothetical protein JAAARDRAFT_597878 [Jaapia argillacea MUCL 33604]|uniref:F-box domain-containing protein n=1 Tax=Jaapia argillacea MUCL 33604 TaxID=933084 RepID=A0A067Q9I1_9AGAM|nr:hypothetical protein JAAARDRAFT_597878 [Jaapia argillacea MUCL 33604]